MTCLAGFVFGNKSGCRPVTRFRLKFMEKVKAEAQAGSWNEECTSESRASELTLVIWQRPGRDLGSYTAGNDLIRNRCEDHPSARSRESHTHTNGPRLGLRRTLFSNFAEGLLWSTIPNQFPQTGISFYSKTLPQKCRLSNEIQPCCVQSRKVEK